MGKDRLRRMWAKTALDRTIHHALAASARDETLALRSLILHVRRVSSLLPPRPGETAGHGQIIGGLAALARHHCDWIRPAETWVPSDRRTLPALTSLAQHLLCSYSVPRFMTSVWWKGASADARRQQEWFKHLGHGQSIRTIELPIPFTRLMAHHFCLAPDHFSVEHALRWGQVRGLGGHEDLVYALTATRLGRQFENDEFWRTVIRFFIHHPRLDFKHINPIVEYLYHQRFECRQVVFEGGTVGTIPPPQPDLSLKGRTVSSLLRDVRQWRKQLGIELRQPELWWLPSGIGGFRFIEEDEIRHNTRIWTIRELLSSAQLRAEGAAMRHCVGSYSRWCIRNRITIWSLRVEDVLGQHRVLTIQVDPKYRIIEYARRFRNAAPLPKDLAILRMWADQEQLTIRF